MVTTSDEKNRRRAGRPTAAQFLRALRGPAVPGSAERVPKKRGAAAGERNRKAGKTSLAADRRGKR
jgi:hypothetical protein